MFVKCPVCQSEYDIMPGKYECSCGIKFSIDMSGNVSLYDVDKQSSAQTVYFEENENELQLGDIILNRYKIISYIDSNCIGSVLKCIDENNGSFVALTLLFPKLAHSIQEMAKIEKRIQQVQCLEHPNILKTYALERDWLNDKYYLVTEWADGVSLEQYLAEKRKNNCVLASETVFSLIRQCAAALDYAHKKNIFYDMLSPKNIFIVNEKDIKISYFGLMSQIHESMVYLDIASEKYIDFLPYYAPERWHDNSSNAQVDQYSLAVITYEMLSGQLPFCSSDIQCLRKKILFDSPEKLKNVSVFINEAVALSMSKEPDRRFADCSKYMIALEHGSNNVFFIKKSMLVNVIVLLFVICSSSFLYLFYKYYQVRKSVQEYSVKKQVSQTADSKHSARFQVSEEKKELNQQRKNNIALKNTKAVSKDESEKKHSKKSNQKLKPQNSKEHKTVEENTKAVSKDESEKKHSKKSNQELKPQNSKEHKTVEENTKAVSKDESEKKHRKKINQNYVRRIAALPAKGHYLRFPHLLTPYATRINWNMQGITYAFTISDYPNSQYRNIFEIKLNDNKALTLQHRRPGNLEIETYDHSEAFSSALLDDGKTHTVLVTASSANIQVYIDGILVGTRRGRHFFDNNKINSIRSMADVSQIVVWNKRLSSDEIADYFFAQKKILQKNIKSFDLKSRWDNLNRSISRSFILTEKKQEVFFGRYTPPYTIRALCKTNKDNIRFLLLGGEIIFNWECNRKDLRLDIPNLSLPHNFPGKGYIIPGRWADITIKVTDSQLLLFVNGRLRVARNGNFKDTKTYVGMRTYQNNIVTVRYFSIKRN